MKNVLFGLSWGQALALLSAGGLILAACSGANDGGDKKVSGAGGSGGSGGNLNDGGFNLGGMGAVGNPGGKLTSTPSCSNTSGDHDGDGFAVEAGDCNDCTVQMNPGAYDYPGNGVDEDCNGAPDDEPVGCDANSVDIGYNDPTFAARAIGICRISDGTSWGLVSARYTSANGQGTMNDASHGLLPNFGPNVAPREGSNVLALSSGTARRPGDLGFRSPVGGQMGQTGPTPPGFPVAAPACPGVIPTQKVANDSAALELKIKVPTNSNALKFDFDFYTYEYPAYICSIFNDFFVALLDPAPAQAQSGNVSFDAMGNPVSVNNGFLEVCQAQTIKGKMFPCSRGTAELQGTGFDETYKISPLGSEENGPHAATGWLVTEAPVPPGQTVTLRFAIWDAGDHILDSTVLIDNFVFDLGQGEPPKTKPVE